MLRTSIKSVSRFGRYSMVRGVSAVVLCGALAACASPPPAPTYSEVSFIDGGAVPIRAARVDIRSTFEPTFKEPNVEHLMPLSPEKVARQWALERLQPLRSGSVVAVFTIKDAEVLETKLKTKGGIEGTFTDEPSERYDATLRAELSYSDAKTGKHGRVETVAKYSMSVQEDASLNDREIAWHDLVEKLGKTFDKAMVANMKRYVPDLIAGTPSE